MPVEKHNNRLFWSHSPHLNPQSHSSFICTLLVSLIICVCPLIASMPARFSAYLPGSCKSCSGFGFLVLAMLAKVLVPLCLWAYRPVIPLRKLLVYNWSYFSSIAATQMLVLWEVASLQCGLMVEGFIKEIPMEWKVCDLISSELPFIVVIFAFSF